MITRPPSTLFVALGWRAITGIAVTAAALLSATALLMPGSLPDYLRRLPDALPYLRTDRPYFWERQVTFLGFWRLMLDGRAGGPNPSSAVALWLVSAAAAAAALARPAWAAIRRDVSPAARDRGLAAAVAAAPLLMPYYMDYDLLLLAVPAALTLSAARVPPGVVAAWVLLWPAAYMNVDAVAAAGVGPVVPLLAALLVATAAAAGLGRWGRSDTIPGGEASACAPRRLAA